MLRKYDENKAGFIILLVTQYNYNWRSYFTLSMAVERGLIGQVSLSSIGWKVTQVIGNRDQMVVIL